MGLTFYRINLYILVKKKIIKKLVQVANYNTMKHLTTYKQIKITDISKQ